MSKNIGIYFDDVTLYKLDAARGKVSRSMAIREILKTVDEEWIRSLLQ